MRTRRIYRDLACIGALGAVGTVASSLLGAQVPVLLWFGLAAVIVQGWRLLGCIAVPDKTETMLREGSEVPAFAMPDRPFAGMRAWEERLELVRGDAEYFRQSVLPMMTALVEERLRLAYGVDVHREPEKARALLGPRLVHLFSGEHDSYDETGRFGDQRLSSGHRLSGQPLWSGRSAPSRSELIALVTELEKLWTNHR